MVANLAVVSIMQMVRVDGVRGQFVVADGIGQSPGHVWPASGAAAAATDATTATTTAAATAATAAASAVDINPPAILFFLARPAHFMKTAKFNIFRQHGRHVPIL